LTKSGYKGKSVDDLIFQLFTATKGSVEEAERGIIYIDEFDKISASKESDLDVGGRSVQQELLKMIEGTDVEITVDELTGEKAFINTSKMLFIFSGAFSNLTDEKECIGNRKSNLRKIGFSNEISNPEVNKSSKSDHRTLSHKDLIEYGMIPELMGRIPIIAQLNKLEVVDLLRIMTESKNSIIKQYKTLFNHENIDLVFKKDALVKIAEIALSRNIGARGLNSIIEERMIQLTFDILDKKKSPQKNKELLPDDKNTKLKNSKYVINSYDVTPPENTKLFLLETIIPAQSLNLTYKNFQHMIKDVAIGLYQMNRQLIMMGDASIYNIGFNPRTKCYILFDFDQSKIFNSNTNYKTKKEYSYEDAYIFLTSFQVTYRTGNKRRLIDALLKKLIESKKTYILSTFLKIIDETIPNFPEKTVPRFKQETTDLDRFLKKHF
jgi:hypothetical protein